MKHEQILRKIDYFFAGVTVGLLIVVALLGTGEGIIDDKPRYRVEAELEGYLESFVNLAELKGIDLSYIYNKNITIIWEPSPDGKRGSRVATAFGRDKDYIVIYVNKERFYQRTEEGRKYVMFHELGHDVLNFPHLEHPDRGMMEPTAYTGFFRDYERFPQDRQQNYLYTSLNTMFERYLAL